MDDFSKHGDISEGEETSDSKKSSNTKSPLDESSVSQSQSRHTHAQTPKTSLIDENYTEKAPPPAPEDNERSEGESSTTTNVIIPVQRDSPPESRSTNSEENTEHPKEKSIINPKESGWSTADSSDEDDALLEIDTSFEDDIEGSSENELLHKSEEKDVQMNATIEEPSTEKSKDVEVVTHRSEAEIEDQFIKKLKHRLAVEFKVTLPSIPFEVEGHSQFVRMPNFIPVEPIPYDAESYTDHMSMEDVKSEQCRENFVSLLKTTIRWRENQNEMGKISKESNARIVRWSDGTETFHVGAEVFDIMHHPVPDDQSQLYVRLDNFYQAQTLVKDKLTLRPKLDSTFGQSHVQGLRDRALSKPQTGCVKVLMDMGTNPILDRKRRLKEELDHLKKEERERRRVDQINLKSRIRPMRHRTADDSDLDEPASSLEDQDKEISLSPSESNQESRPGLRTNRNATVKPSKFVDTDTDTDDDTDDENEDDEDEDINDIIDDGDLDYEQEADTEGTSSEEEQRKVVKQKPKKVDTDSDGSDVGRNFKRTKRKAKHFTYSDDSDN